MKAQLLKDMVTLENEKALISSTEIMHKFEDGRILSLFDYFQNKRIGKECNIGRGQTITDNDLKNASFAVIFIGGNGWGGATSCIASAGWKYGVYFKAPGVREGFVGVNFETGTINLSDYLTPADAVIQHYDIYK